MKKILDWPVCLYVKFRNWFIEPADNIWAAVAKFFVVVAIILAFIGAYCLMIAILAKFGSVGVSNNKDAQNWPYGGFNW